MALSHANVRPHTVFPALVGLQVEEGVFLYNIPLGIKAVIIWESLNVLTQSEKGVSLSGMGRKKRVLLKVGVA